VAHQYQRWYDKDRGCSRMIDQLEDLNFPIVRLFCAKFISRIAMEIRDKLSGRATSTDPDSDKVIVSLGLPALKGLYAAKQSSRRWYDKDPQIQKAITSLYSLSQEGLTVLTFKLNDVMGLLQLYDTVCYSTDQEPTVQEMFKIAKAGLTEGIEVAEEVMVDILGFDVFKQLQGTDEVED
jgi:hypothetical protein